RGPGDLALVRAERADVVERDRAWCVDAECLEQGRLRALAQLQREHVGAVQHTGAAVFERPHEREGEGHGPRVAADVGARACLIEIQTRGWTLDVAERRPLQVERRIANPAPLERLEQRLLPLRMLVNDDEISAGHLLNHSLTS